MIVPPIGQSLAHMLAIRSKVLGPMQALMFDNLGVLGFTSSSWAYGFDRALPRIFRPAKQFVKQVGVIGPDCPHNFVRQKHELVLPTFLCWSMGIRVLLASRSSSIIMQLCRKANRTYFSARRPWNSDLVHLRQHVSLAHKPHVEAAQQPTVKQK